MIPESKLGGSTGNRKNNKSIEPHFDAHYDTPIEALGQTEREEFSPGNRTNYRAKYLEKGSML